MSNELDIKRLEFCRRLKYKGVFAEDTVELPSIFPHVTLKDLVDFDAPLPEEDRIPKPVAPPKTPTYATPPKYSDDDYANWMNS